MTMSTLTDTFSFVKLQSNQDNGTMWTLWEKHALQHDAISVLHLMINCIDNCTALIAMKMLYIYAVCVI